ncbi:hypothetical protein [Flavobacterium suzhouense]|uniref:Uncharacterized protein n=1 Tax=Flavobacterium suzhouense TaxID=1529638 RepID=A0ABW5NU63_9FLAO
MHTTSVPLYEFKILAVRPHTDCSKNISKVLRNGMLYQFYNHYTFLNSEGNAVTPNDEIVAYEPNDLVPNDLYTIDNLQINISAIVGKNGCGKSTLIELILYCTYILGINLTDTDGNTLLPTHFQQLEKYIGEKKYLLRKQREEKRKILDAISQNKADSADFEKKLDTLINLPGKPLDLLRDIDDMEKQQRDAEEEHKSIIAGLHCSIYFEINDVVWEFNTDTFNQKITSDINENDLAGKIKAINIHDLDSQGLLNNFFYNIVLNYSHHALNSRFLGYWVNTLFHKNDGYKTPGVINPMRTEGDFEINTEIHLSKYRLLGNLLAEALHNKGKKLLVTEKQYLHKVRFTHKPTGDKNKISLGTPGSPIKQEDFIIGGPSDLVNVILKILPLYFEGSFDDVAVLDKDQPYTVELINYLGKKVLKIFKNYPEYNPKEEFTNILDFFEKALPIIREDESHVTFKVHRTAFFLKKNLYSTNKAKWGEDNNSIEFTLDELLDWMEIESPEDSLSIFETMPPSIFDIDFILDESDNYKEYEKDAEKDLPLLTSLSSGEQQKLYIINTVIYHLNNLYSVHYSSKKVQRLKYSYVNIIFDEIELYFHPDMQRRFIDYLLTTLKRYSFITQESEKCIKALNILFSTHSPFILSDIPRQNILLLEYDVELKQSVPQTIDKQTFGANIHELLANSFFFNDASFIGEKADKILKSLIKRIVELRENKIRIGDEEFKSLTEKIAIIGEPFFREKLKEMLWDVYNVK